VNLKDKVIVVTGAGNGIGREVALALVRKGAKVAGVDLSEAALAETVKLSGPGAPISTHVVNLTDVTAVNVLPGSVQAAHGQVDGVVNVAGIIQKFVPIRELSHDDIAKVINVNLWGTININTAFLEALVARPEAALVNISSMGGLIPFPGQTAYSASKAAVKLWTEGLQAELLETKVKVTVVFPGAIATNIARNSGLEGMSLEEAGKDSPIKMTPPNEAARQIVQAIEKGTPRVRIGNDAKLLDRLSRLMPTKSILLIAKQMAKALARKQ
jgi:short-subunit dehydrogenase